MIETVEQNATDHAVKSDMPAAQKHKLLDQVRDRIRVKHCSLSTEKTYLTHVLNRVGRGVVSPLDRI